MTTPIYGGFPFSMFDPVHLGIDENGEHVYVNLAERNMLLGGEPGAGKSVRAQPHRRPRRAVLRLQAHPDRRQAGRARPLARLRRHVHRPVHHRRHRRVRRTSSSIMNARYDDAARHRAPQDHPRRRRARLPDRHRRVRLLLRHRRHQGRTRRSSPPSPATCVARGRAAGRHRHPGHPAALPPGHRPVPAGPVRLPVGVPLHHRLLLRRRARPGLGLRGLHRRRHRPARPRRRLAAVRDRHPPPRSRPPTSPTTDIH